MDRSLCEYFYNPKDLEGHRCGYCKSKDTSISQGMWAHQLTCEDYQDLIDRGWRRSGKYCYKPLMDKTCCPQYCIRCEVTDFKLSHSQKSVLKKMNTFLSTGKKGALETQLPQKADAEKAESANPTKTSVRPGVGADPTKPPCKKAKVIRQERREAKAAAKKAVAEQPKGPDDKPPAAKQDVPDSSSKPELFEVGPDGRKPIEMFLEQPTSSSASPSHRLEIKLIQSSPPSPEFKATFNTSYKLFRKYQMTVHQEKAEDCTEKTFRRFLCDSPLTHTPGPEEWPCGYGSYHQHYLLDGKLIAVGVIDILPKCLSSVYVFYDVDYNFLSPGVYSALREIAMTRSLYVHSPDRFKYYYMGYYIHSCQKMRYKGQYTPSFLLCPRAYKFVPIEACRPKLDISKYSPLCDEESPAPVTEYDSIIIFFQRALFPYGVLKSLVGEKYEAAVKEWANFVGPEVAKRMVLAVA